VAVDAAGAVYVVDRGSQAVRRFTPSGAEFTEFWTRVSADGRVRRPVNVAASGDTIFVLDAEARTVFAFQSDGSPVLDPSGHPLEIGRGLLNDPSALAAGQDNVYVGDRASGRVLVFAGDAGFALAGHAVDFDGPVSALALDGCGSLYVHPGDDGVAVLQLRGAVAARGLLFGGPFSTSEPTTTWHRLRALGQTPDGTDVQLFVHTSDTATPPPPYEPTFADPFPAPAWRTAPARVGDLFIDSKPGRYLWVGAVLTSDGDVTPRLSDLRAEFNHDTLLPLLPRPYRAEAFHDDQLTRLLSLLETFFDDVDDRADEQLSWLDPFAAPAPLLPWLASWLEVDLDDRWSDDERRRAIAGAYERFRRVGTVDALRQALWHEAGVRAVIHEPARSGRVWVLGGCRTGDVTALGAATTLAAAEPDGAIVGRSATLGGSHLIRGDELGGPLFEASAHRFIVHITERAFRTSRRARAERVIERDKPAHTAYHLCEIRPRLTVGIQARLGLTTIIGGQRRPGGLDEGELVLSGAPAGRLGSGLDLGRSTRL
jgi:phage tail-like protein